MAASQLLAAQRLSVKDITSGAFSAKTLKEVTPMADGESYCQISDDRQQILQYSFRTGKQTAVLFDANTARGPKVNRIDGYIVSPDGKRLLIQTETKGIYRHSFTAQYYIFMIKSNKLEPLSEGGPQQTPVFSPDGNVIAFVRDNNIFLVKLLYDNAESQITSDGKKNEVINGLPDWVNEEEFSFNSAMVFSADSKQVVWVRYDESRVRQYQMQLFKASYPERSEYADYPGLYSYKYPVAGEQNATLSVKSFDIKSRQTRTMQLPLDPDGYIARIKATEDPTKVALFTLNRHQDRMSVYMANPLSTVCTKVLEDKVDKYIREDAYGQTMIAGNHIVMPSERDGYNHLYIYSLSGQLVRKVGDLPAKAALLSEQPHTIVTSVYGYDEPSGDLYFAARAEGPTEQKVYVSHQNGKTECLTPKQGTNTAIFSRNFKYFVHQWSDLQTPPVYEICNSQGKRLTTLIDNQELAGKYDSYDMGSKELFAFKTAEGVELAGWIVKPHDFNPQKKYPVILYQYGGPGSQQVINRWGIGMSGNGALMEQLMAQKGYVVCCVDNRGTGGRGAAFEKAIYLRLGELEARDQVETALWIGRQPWADKERIGMWGWSYGGWNTLMAMSEGRPVFRCGIAIAPPTCWRYYDTIYTERYMRTPKENQDGYDNVCPIARASQLSGALMICHGLADDNVHYQNTAEYTDALVQADKDFVQLVYTNRNHSIYGGNTRNHLFRQCLNFFDREMK